MLSKYRSTIPLAVKPEPDTSTVALGGAVDFESEIPSVTVKLVALVAVPPPVVTLILPVLAPAGTVALTEVGVLFEKVALLPLNLTAVTPDRFVPVMVTTVPIGPLVGLKLLMVGAAARTAPGAATTTRATATRRARSARRIGIVTVTISSTTRTVGPRIFVSFGPFGSIDHACGSPEWFLRSCPPPCRRGSQPTAAPMKRGAAITWAGRGHFGGGLFDRSGEAASLSGARKCVRLARACARALKVCTLEPDSVRSSQSHFGG